MFLAVFRFGNDSRDLSSCLSSLVCFLPLPLCLSANLFENWRNLRRLVCVCLACAAVKLRPYWHRLIEQHWSPNAGRRRRQRRRRRSRLRRRHSFIHIHYHHLPLSLTVSFSTLKSVELIISTLSPAIRAAEKKDNKLWVTLQNGLFSATIYSTWWETFFFCQTFTRQSQ